MGAVIVEIGQDEAEHRPMVAEVVASALVVRGPLLLVGRVETVSKRPLELGPHLDVLPHVPVQVGVRVLYPAPLVPLRLDDGLLLGDEAVHRHASREPAEGGPEGSVRALAGGGRAKHPIEHLYLTALVLLHDVRLRVERLGGGGDHVVGESQTVELVRDLARVPVPREMEELDVVVPHPGERLGVGLVARHRDGDRAGAARTLGVQRHITGKVLIGHSLRVIHLVQRHALVPVMLLRCLARQATKHALVLGQPPLVLVLGHGDPVTVEPAPIGRVEAGDVKLVPGPLVLGQPVRGLGDRCHGASFLDPHGAGVIPYLVKHFYECLGGSFVGGPVAGPPLLQSVDRLDRPVGGDLINAPAILTGNLSDEIPGLPVEREPRVFVMEDAVLVVTEFQPLLGIRVAEQPLERDNPEGQARVELRGFLLWIDVHGAPGGVALPLLQTLHT